MIQFALAALLVTQTPTPDEGASQAALVEQAAALWHKEQNYDGALAAFDAAVAVDPENADARFQRASYLMWLSSVVVADQAEQFRERARQDLVFLATHEPDSRVAGIARDTLAEFMGRQLFPERKPECSEEAMTVLSLANRHFQSGALEEALATYTVAAELCPAEAILWVYVANTNYSLDRVEASREHFRKALSLDPWSKQAHRFLADAEWQVGEAETALREAVLAVISDPTYEAGWASLRDMASQSGRAFHRVYRQKLGLGINAEADKVDLALPEGLDDTAKAIWLVYGMSRAAELRERGLDQPDPDPLASERRAVEAALDQLPQPEGTAPARSADPFWDVMRTARDGGFLDEAILIHLIDEDLVPAFKGRRESQPERMIEYIEELLIPVQ